METSDKKKKDELSNNFTYDKEDEYEALAKQYQNRQPFKYDLNADALYQQYKNAFANQGKLAMQDTIGQASAMTGGYGNSYAATAGNQAYQASLANMNNVIPELYQMAYNRYSQEGQDMLNRLSMYESDRANKYSMFRDQVADQKWQMQFDAQYGTGGETEIDTSGWSALDWEGYFAGIRNGENGSVEEAVVELERMIAEGLIPDDMIAYARIGAQGSMGH